MFNKTIYLVSSSVYELAWICRLPLQALTQLDFLRDDSEKTEEGTVTSEGEAEGSEVARIEAELDALGMLLDCLVQQQRSDGSWGSGAYSPGDRLVNTLAVVVALAHNQVRWEEAQGYKAYKFPEYYRRSMWAGITWLRRQAQKGFLKNDTADLAGLELIVPALQSELEKYGIKIKTNIAIAEKAKAKLQKVPVEIIFQPGSTLSHALEFCGTLLSPNPAQFNRVISLNGSVGNSPSATAFALASSWNDLSQERRQEMLDYLNRSVNASFFWRQVYPAAPTAGITRLPVQSAGFVGLGWPVTYPVNHFLEIWHKYYETNLDSNKSRSTVTGLERSVVESWPINKSGKAGFGADEHFAIDADTTATFICLAAQELIESGQVARLWASLEVLQEFFNAEKGYFFTYPYEMTPSITTNAHAWQALNTVLQLISRLKLTVPEQMTNLATMKNLVATYIKSRVIKKTFWHDKWHMSPVYATYHVALSGVVNQKEDGSTWTGRIIDWLVENQSRVDGGWSFVEVENYASRSAIASEEKPFPRSTPPPKSNVDETFHALLLLLHAWQNWLTDNSGFEGGKISSFEQERRRIQVANALQQGMICLQELIQHQPPYTWPAMWCDKTLYCPYGLLYKLSKKLLKELNQLDLADRTLFRRLAANSPLVERLQGLRT